MGTVPSAPRPTPAGIAPLTPPPVAGAAPRTAPMGTVPPPPPGSGPAPRGTPAGLAPLTPPPVASTQPRAAPVGTVPPPPPVAGTPPRVTSAGTSPLTPPPVAPRAIVPPPPPVAGAAPHGAVPSIPPGVPSIAPAVPSIAPAAPSVRPATTPLAGPPHTTVPSIAPAVPPQGAAPRGPALTPRPPPTLAVGQVVPPPPPTPAPQARPGARPTMSLPALAPSDLPPRPPAAATVPGIPPMTAPRVPAISPMVPPIAPAVPSIAPMAPPPPPSAAKGPGLDEHQLADLQSRCAKLDQLDYFEVLLLERTATPADIKKAFYRESRTYHPDRFFHIDDKQLKEQVHELYKRVTEAYYVLRDDTKRKKYLVDVTGAERAQKLRFTEASESETKAAAKKEQEEQIGTHPKGRQFYQQSQKDIDAGNWSAAERNLKMALTYEPSNPRYKESLAEAQKRLSEEAKAKGDSFKIR
nr:DnaJ domain-containing protein [Myxococcus sp. CA051A]